MTESELIRIEQALDLTLPEEYREAVIDAALAPADEFGPGLCGDADALIHDNVYLRSEGFYGQTWNPSHFVIRNDGCGNYYFIRCPFDNTVYFADHEDTFDGDDLSSLKQWCSFYEFRYA